jgi:hypothetical protein
LQHQLVTFDTIKEMSFSPAGKDLLDWLCAMDKMEGVNDYEPKLMALMIRLGIARTRLYPEVKSYVDAVAAVADDNDADWDG